MRKIARLILIFTTLLVFSCGSDDSGFTLGPGNGVSGIGGSTARFTISGNYMYMANNSHLKVMELTNPAEPKLVHEQTLKVHLETVFASADYLYVGSRQEMLIFTLALPHEPRYISNVSHQTACDPVIVTGNTAYMTIHDGQVCRGLQVNLLITADVSDPTNPIQTDTISMIKPLGLTIYNGDLYVGEGIYGLKKFDITDPLHPKLDTFYQKIASNDMIGLSDRLIITADNGISQYAVEQDTLVLQSLIN
ncbi:MAG: hypothetical protein ABJN36_01400 [Cyclobacteriaceae bacterium]